MKKIFEFIRKNGFPHPLLQKFEDAAAVQKVDNAKKPTFHYEFQFGMSTQDAEELRKMVDRKRGRKYIGKIHFDAPPFRRREQVDIVGVRLGFSLKGDSPKMQERHGLGLRLVRHLIEKTKESLRRSD